MKKLMLGVIIAASALVWTGCGVLEESANTAETDSLGEARQALSYVDLGMVMGSPVTNGNTYNAANAINPPAWCSDGSPGGPELSFKWTAPHTNTYTFSTAGSALDSILHIYAFSPASASTLLECNNDIDFNSGVYASSVTKELAAGTQIRIVVDSYEAVSSRSGSFKLNITPLNPPCSSPQNSCYEQIGEWNGTQCIYDPLPAGTACSDGNACTTGDACNGFGSCGAQPVNCDNAQKPPQVASLSCSAGTCSVIQSCAPGYTDCDGNFTNGCEANLLSNVNHCGACGNTCSEGQVCSSGTCVTPCRICQGSGVTCCSPEICRPKPFNPNYEICSGAL
jgi:hypothetical protein